MSCFDTGTVHPLQHFHAGTITLVWGETVLEGGKTLCFRDARVLGKGEVVEVRKTLHGSLPN